MYAVIKTAVTLDGEISLTPYLHDFPLMPAVTKATSKQGHLNFLCYNKNNHYS